MKKTTPKNHIWFIDNILQTIMKKLLILVLLCTFSFAVKAQRLMNGSRSTVGYIENGRVMNSSRSTLGYIEDGRILNSSRSTIGYLENGRVMNSSRSTIGYIEDNRVMNGSRSTIGYIEDGRVMNDSRTTIGYYESLKGSYAALFFFFFFDWNPRISFTSKHSVKFHLPQPWNSAFAPLHCPKESLPAFPSNAWFGTTLDSKHPADGAG